MKPKTKQRLEAAKAAQKAARDAQPPAGPVKRRKGGPQPGSGRPKGVGLGVRIAPATRDRIRGAMLVKRLERIAFGEVIAEPHEVTAGLGLLRFQLPTLAAQEVTGKDGGPLAVTVTLEKRE